MAVLTPLEPSAAQGILDAYGLGRLCALVPLPQGSVNSNFRAETDRGPFFLRIFEEQGPEGAGYERRLLAHLAAGGVPTPAPLPDDRGVTVAGKPVAVFPWVCGEPLCQARVGAAEASAV